MMEAEPGGTLQYKSMLGAVVPSLSSLGKPKLKLKFPLNDCPPAPGAISYIFKEHLTSVKLLGSDS